MGPIVAAFIVGLTLAGAAHAEPGAAPPRIRAPNYPLEPGRKAPQPIDEKSYVEGPDAPPPAPDDAVLLKRIPKDGEWGVNFDLGWFLSSHTARHNFTGPTVGTLTARRTNSNALSLASSLRVRPPSFPVSLAVSVSATSGRAEASTAGDAIPLTRFNVQEFRGALGPRLHLLRRASSHDIRLGADVEGGITSYATLTAQQNQLDVDFRNFVLAVPKLEWVYSPRSNWSLELAGGYGFMMTAAGTGDVKATSFKRIQGELKAIRYLAGGHGIGFGGNYTDEKVTWEGTSPSVLKDEVLTRDLRLLLFWRKDL